MCLWGGRRFRTKSEILPIFFTASKEKMQNWFGDLWLRPDRQTKSSPHTEYEWLGGDLIWWTIHLKPDYDDAPFLVLSYYMFSHRDYMYVFYLARRLADCHHPGNIPTAWASGGLATHHRIVMCPWYTTTCRGGRKHLGERDFKPKNMLRKYKPYISLTRFRVRTNKQKHDPHC